ncbi:uncharacterized protein ALTATR162_LOCUS4573 [Alternaria atra]|uniref:F-box domain-containing protein n=1 Tax=Alternaria atra TaxID=119953 RepID=A0A8J2I8G9_9PLEO|nr:uncharacterized protein ALTATR162_LOCUS4573 [Alternaria atra]CAG5156779.1 unnamed protein product [Alternaria atra]
MASDAPSCPFLRLPRELRYEIYDHLCRQDFKSYPFRKLPISSIDQTGPPTALLVTCRYLCDEISTYFMAKVTLGLIAQHTPLCSEEIDPIPLSVIQKAKKIDVRIDWQRVPQAGVDISHWPYQVNGWLADLVHLLLDKTKGLEIITMSFVELGRGTNWEQKERTLTPLKNIAGRVRFRLGDVITEDEKAAELKERLGIYLGELNEVVLPAVGS